MAANQPAERGRLTLPALRLPALSVPKIAFEAKWAGLKDLKVGEKPNRDEARLRATLLEAPGYPAAANAGGRLPAGWWERCGFLCPRSTFS